jgi:hypothetical protein
MENLGALILVENADARQFLALIARVNGNRAEVVFDAAVGELLLGE